MRGFIGLTVRDAMIHPVATVSPEMTLSDLEGLFDRYDYNTFPVVRDDRLVGIVTKFDFLRNFIFTTESVLPHYDDLMQRQIGTIMRREVTTVAADTPLTRVLQMMVDLSSKSFPVVSDGRVIGIISLEDIIRALRRSVGR